MIASENLTGVSGVYCAIHRETGKCYVGSSTDMGRRMAQHTRYAKKGVGCHFHRELARLGSDSFDFEVLSRCEKWNLLDTEKLFITLLGSVGSGGFNLVRDPREGYTGLVFRAGWSHSSETKEKIRLAHLGMRQGSAAISKIRAARATQVFSKESILKASASNFGAKRTDEAKLKMRLAQLGKKASPESKQKMRLAKVGKTASEEARKNMSLAQSARRKKEFAEA
jgi:group I intron endonuclease